jgi:hypothetical protein
MCVKCGPDPCAKILDHWSRCVLFSTYIACSYPEPLSLAQLPWIRMPRSNKTCLTCLCVRCVSWSTCSMCSNIVHLSFAPLPWICAPASNKTRLTRLCVRCVLEPYASILTGWSWCVSCWIYSTRSHPVPLYLAQLLWKQAPAFNKTRLTRLCNRYLPEPSSSIIAGWSRCAPCWIYSMCLHPVPLSLAHLPWIHGSASLKAFHNKTQMFWDLPLFFFLLLISLPSISLNLSHVLHYGSLICIQIYI